MRHPRLVLAALAVALTSACGLAPAPPDVLAPYASATLTAGEGLGDLRFDSTTLRPFLAGFPGGRLAAVVGDETGVEVVFPAQGLAFLFVLDESCTSEVGARTRQLLTDLGRADAFFAAHPDCGSAPLRSISVSAGSVPEQTFYTGRTDADLPLFAPLDDLHAQEGDPGDVRGLWLADSSTADERFDTHAYPRGIVYMVGEATDGPAKDHLVVQKIAIFPAQ